MICTHPHWLQVTVWFVLVFHVCSDRQDGCVCVDKMFKSKPKEEKVLEGVDNAKSAYSDEAWTQSELLQEPPLLQITQPKGSFCTIDTRFAAALDPDGVYDILTDPNNHRVFKNIKV